MDLISIQHPTYIIRFWIPYFLKVFLFSEFRFQEILDKVSLINLNKNGTNKCKTSNLHYIVLDPSKICLNV